MNFHTQFRDKTPALGLFRVMLGAKVDHFLARSIQWLGAQIAECRERPKQQPYGNPCPCLAPLLRRNRARSERLAVKQLVGRNSVTYCTAVDGWMMAVFADAKSTVIISHKPPILPSAAAMHSLKPVALFLRIPTRPFDV